jgi:hypothetical protein
MTLSAWIARHLIADDPYEDVSQLDLRDGLDARMTPTSVEVGVECRAGLRSCDLRADVEGAAAEGLDVAG